MVQSAMSGAKQTMTKALFEQLREEILTGKIEPGTHLRQQEVAKRFAVSTTPVREAFSALEREGLVLGEAHRGVVVFQPTAQELREIYDIRLALETLAIREAAERVTDAELRRMRALLTKMAAVLDDHDAYNALNGRFHDLVYQASGSQRLADLIRQQREAVNVYLRIYAKQETSTVHVHDDHVRIYQAVHDHDADAAVRYLARHLARTVDFITHYLPAGPSSGKAESGEAPT